MFLDDNEEKELKNLTKRKKQEKWFEIFLILCELEDKYKINSFSFYDNTLLVNVNDGSILRIFLV